MFQFHLAFKISLRVLFEPPESRAILKSLNAFFEAQNWRFKTPRSVFLLNKIWRVVGAAITTK